MRTGDALTLNADGLVVPIYTREDRLMEEQLRCTCGAWDKIEEALETLASSEKARKLTWVIHNKRLEFMAEIAGIGVNVNGACQLGAAILELADKVKPPKPKEREWRVGDEFLHPNGDRYLMTEYNKRGSRDGPSCNLLGIGFDGFSGLHVSQMKREGWRNLTIEGEQAGEK